MKHFGILLCVTLMLFSFSLFAETAVLIDFTQLITDTDLDGDGQNDENQRTLIDFADKAGTSFTEQEKQFMRTSLAIPNWEVVLASSARNITNQRYSYIMQAPVRDSASNYGGDTVMGVRIHFPEDPFNSYAIIKPPFEIPSYQPLNDEDMYGSMFDNFGVVKNVGFLRSLSITTLGRNHPHGLGVIVKDQDNRERIIFISYLNFDGWKTLTWNNPAYIPDVRNRQLQRAPLYPNSTPNIKLVGLIVYKDAAQVGGDFIGYFRDLSITFDKAVVDLESDIDDEALWGILGAREESRRTAEYERLGGIQVLRYLERQRMHTEEASPTN
ncbi:MAG: flagellar filament outer layer protein FlaA [Spirochaetales bacterium]|jgi:hypothetical protein|nr:flagellar filament outer layer protein FlaA [Spirochaetales bacterium]